MGQGTAGDRSELPQYGTQDYADSLIRCSLVFGRLGGAKQSDFLFSRLIPLMETHSSISVPNAKSISATLTKTVEEIRNSLSPVKFSKREAFAYLLGNFDCVTMFATEALISIVERGK